MVTNALGKVLMYYCDSAGRVTKTGAGAAGSLMPTLNFYPPSADLRHTTAQMTKLLDWTSGC